MRIVFAVTPGSAVERGGRAGRDRAGEHEHGEDELGAAHRCGGLLRFASARDGSREFANARRLRITPAAPPGATSMIRISTTPNATAGAPGASVSMSPSTGMKSGIDALGALRPLDLHEVDEDRAEDERPERAEPADDDADEQEDRERDRERVRVDERGRDREQRAGDAGVERADPEGERLVAGEVDAGGRGRQLAVADRAQRPAEAAAEHQPGAGVHDERDRPAEVVEPVVEVRDLEPEHLDRSDGLLERDRIGDRLDRRPGLEVEEVDPAAPARELGEAPARSRATRPRSRRSRARGRDR